MANYLGSYWMLELLIHFVDWEAIRHCSICLLLGVNKTRVYITYTYFQNKHL